MKERDKRVLVGMSGGIDSTATCLMLQEQGYEIVGVTMRVWGDEPQDARELAARMGIEHYVADERIPFKETIVKNFIDEYKQGRTPNPCVMCNPLFKFRVLAEWADKLDCAYIATGHYARIEQLANGRYAIANSVTAAKDQTYALYNLTQEQLSHTLMPVGDYTKDQIREIAAKIGLPVAKKKDSQEICFVPDQDYASFIQNETGIVAPKGNFVNTKGEILGTHEGITHYTVGQRRGLGLPMGHRVFVLEIRPETNEVVIGENEDVFSNRLTCRNLNWMAIEDLGDQEMRVSAKIRYSHKGALCTIRKIGEDRVECVFDEPQRAATPGQAVVFYDGEYVVGGGTIE